MSKPINSLQANASGFFEKVIQKNADQMACKAGCSQCCYTDISVFDVEADLIREWFDHLVDSEKVQLKELWKNKVADGACAFLYNDQCSIYEFRPIICRTQGLPLHLSQENILDYCPKNFKETEPEKADWLNLDRLNTLLAFAANSAKRENRIRLKKLKDELLKK